MQSISFYDFVMIGHFSKDIIIHDDKKILSKGGGIYYGSVVLKRMGYEVAVITKLAREDFHLLKELENLGIKVIYREAPVTSSIENIYYTKDMDRRKTRLLGFAGSYTKEDIPKNLRWNVLMITPIIAGEIDLELLRYLRKKTSGMLALDIQGFIRVPEDGKLVYRDWNEKDKGLPLVDVLKMDDAEAEVLTGEKDLKKAAKEVASYGVKEILITHTKGLLVYANGEFIEAYWTAKKLDGRTGRGDTCFASYMGMRIHSSPKEATKFAVEITSRKIEVPGPYYGPIPQLKTVIH